MHKTALYKNNYLLSYADFGDPAGFPILIQHGLIASIQHTHLFDRLVQSGRRLICIARPGYGGSSPLELPNVAAWADLVSVIVDDLNLARFDVFGISSGAPYSYALGWKFADRVRDIFILSGTPALYDENVLALWPYPDNRRAGIPELQKLAYALFFAHLPPEALSSADVQDSMQNDCFGIALDLKIRCHPWGFSLPDVPSRVTMRHSRFDRAVPLAAAELTAKYLPDCRLDIRENDDHFSQAALDDFIITLITP